jgi:LacI family transcriptional regulator
MRSANVYDVAGAAGVSTATVSRYFRAPDKLSASTRERVRRAVAELGYLPSGSARALAERQTGAIGVYSFSGHEPDEVWEPSAATNGLRPDRAGEEEDIVVRVAGQRRRPRLFPLFADEVLRGAEIECTVRRTPLVVGWQPGTSVGVELEEIARRVDGVVVLPSTVDAEAVAQLSRTKAVVLVAQPAPRDVIADAVVIDNEGAMRALVEHLIEEHAVDSFWYAGSDVGHEHEARRRGWEAALDARGLRADTPDITDGGSRAAARAVIADLLRSLVPPRAIVCASDQTALGVMEALHDAGLRVPEDVVVTGFDGIDAGEFARPTLTTIRQPMEALGRTAVSLLASRLEAPDTAARVVRLPVELVLRASCGCTSVDGGSS